MQYGARKTQVPVHQLQSLGRPAGTCQTPCDGCGIETGNQG